MTKSFMTAQVPKKQIGNLVIEGIPEIPQQLTERLRQYQNTREAVVVDWLKDGDGIILSTRFGETSQFHLVTQPEGNRQQITFFKEPLFSGQVCPNPKRNGILFAKDIGGNEAYQIFYFDRETGDYQMLTDGESRHSGGIWSPSGQYFAYAGTQKNQTDYHIYIQHIDFPGHETLVFEREGYWMVSGWSSDNKYLTLCNYCSINESYIYILNIETKEVTPITNSNQPIAYRGGVWDLEGNGIYITADDEGEFRQLKYYNISSGRMHTITQELEWDVEQLSLSPDGQTLAFTINENGINKLYLLDTNTHFYEEVPNIPLGQVSGLKWHPNGQKLALTIDTAQSPSDVFVLDIVLHELERWTFSEVGGLNPKHFVIPSLIHYPTFDTDNGQQRMIPAFYYRPKHVKGPHPVLIYIHGGPESQYRPSFSSVFQYYINELGIAVIAPNVRGSVGYGKSYVQLDVGYKREDSVKDIGSLLDWIETQPELNANKVAVIGGSYGGYMVLASMTHFNERLKCGIDIVGISNFVTFLKNTKSYRRDLRRVKYGDERDPKMRQHLESISPTTNAHKITKPMLIAQGLNDPRVPASEAEQMLKAIRKNGGHVWYVLAKDEGHGFRKKTNQDYYIRAVMLFLKQYLLGTMD